MQRKRLHEKTMNTASKTAGRFTLRNEAAACTVSVIFSLTIFFFASSELYCRNPLDYLLGDREILLPMLLFSAAAAAGLLLLLNLMLLLNEKLFHVLLCILFGMTLSGYVQMTFYNQRMHTLDGSFSPSYPSDLYGYINFGVWFLLPMLPLLVYAGAVSKNKQPKIQILSLLSAALLLMQGAGFFSVYTVKQKNFRSESGYRIKYISYDPMLSFSKEKNIVVFLLDTMDGYWTDTALKCYPEIGEMLDGFTYYQNNISVYPHTFPSVPEMISGVRYQNEPCLEYLDKVWSSQNLPGLLHASQYTVNMIPDGSTCFQSCGQISGSIDNLREMDPPAYNYLGENGIVPTQIRFSLMRMLPYILKEIPGSGLTSQFAEHFICMDDLPDDYHKTIVSAESDDRFYTYLLQHGIRTDSEKPVFSFYHLNGAHDFGSVRDTDYTLTEKEGYTKKELKYAGTIRAEMDIVDTVLKQMKEQGIYDQSVILILGDHGHSPKDFTKQYEETLPGEILTALMIKPADAPHGALKTDPDTALSNAFFPASILEYAGIGHSEYGLSYQDVIASHANPARRWVYHEFTGSFTDPLPHGEYTVSGNARDFGNWKRTG